MNNPAADRALVRTIDRQDNLRVQPPALVERRGERLLLAWDSPAQWLLGDSELLALINALDGTRGLGEAIALLAEGNAARAERLARELPFALAELERRGLLGDPRPVPEERVELANITYYPTNRCNLRCRWCYNAGRSAPEAPVAQVMDALEDARGLLTPDATLNLLGGEPTFDRERLEECLERAAELFTRPVLLSTNGTLVDGALARLLARHRVEVQVSLDGPDAETNDAVRGAGAFELALRGIARLRDAGAGVILSMVFDRDGAALFERYLDLAQQLGAAEARFIPMRVIGGGGEYGDKRPDLLAAYRELRAIKLRRPGLAGLLKRDFFSILGSVCAQPGLRTGCGLGTKVLFIDADGSIYPCPNLAGPQWRAGTCGTDGLAELMHGSPVFTSLREACHVARRPACNACTLRHWCAGDCRSEAACVSGGSLTAPAVHCAELRALIPELLWDSLDGAA